MASKDTFSSMRSILKMNTQFLMPYSRNLKTNMKDKGGGSSKGCDFKRRYPRTPSQSIDGVLPLHNLCAKICNKHGRVQEVQHSSQCEESPYLQLHTRKDPSTK